MQHRARLSTNLLDWLALAWLAAITCLSLLPLPAPPELQGSDKLQHFVAYGLLAATATYHRRTYFAIVALAVAIVLYGGLIELVQPLVNRHGTFGDFVANLAGVAAGVAVMLSLSWAGERLRAR